MKYKTIYADPPWMEHGGGKIQRGADRHYPLMATKEIMALPVRELADPEGCHLYLWTTNNFLPDALEVVRAWGFQYVTMITWMKDRQGLGQYYRGLTEHCIFARTKQKLPYKLHDGKRVQGVTGFYAPKGKHSEKPEEMRSMIERVSYGPRLELFARKAHDGWDVWGNEVDGIEIARENRRICGTCRWFADDVEVCVNDKSAHCADFVGANDGCAYWEATE